ncbi:MAG: hypothetical protein V1875_05045 [Candidatus Altiarchaeota archaeon]
MDFRIGQGSLVALFVVAALTMFLSVWQNSSDALKYGLIARVFDPLVAVSSFVLGILVSLLFQWGIHAAHFEKIMRLLPVGQQKVLEVLCRSRSVTMEYLCYASRLPKNTVSKALSLLQTKDFIKKARDSNQGLVESRIFVMQHATDTLKRLSGITEGRLFIALAAVFVFGMAFSMLNSYHTMVLQHPFKPTAYVLSGEFIVLGGLSSILARRFITNRHFQKAISVLPDDEQKLLRHIFTAKSVTQHELVLRTGMYKMKVSRILRKFQEKGLIDRMPYGYTNLIISRI